LWSNVLERVGSFALCLTAFLSFTTKKRILGLSGKVKMTPKIPEKTPAKPRKKDWPMEFSAESLDKVLAEEKEANLKRLNGKPPVAMVWPED
jgi:hypothetical protein